MRIIRTEEVKELEQAELKKHPEYKKMDVYRHVKRWMPIIYSIVIFLSTILAVCMPHNYIEWLADIQHPWVVKVIVVSIIWIMMVLILVMVMTPLHEVLHAVPLGIRRCYMLVNLPQTVSVYSNQWHSKCRTLLSMMLPFVFYTIVAIVVIVISGAWYPCLWFMLINMACSATDIFMFTYIMVKIPANAMICNYYYYIPMVA